MLVMYFIGVVPGMSAVAALPLMWALDVTNVNAGYWTCYWLTVFGWWALETVSQTRQFCGAEGK